MYSLGFFNIKCDNILIDNERIKLIDYGLSFSENKILNNYMSPELYFN